MNRIAKIEKTASNAAGLINADGNNIGAIYVGGSDLWLASDLLGELARRWPGLPTPSEPMFKPGDEGLTRNGLRYLVRLTDARGGYPILVEIEASDGAWYATWRHADGCVYRTGEDSLDLIPPHRPTRVSDEMVAEAIRALSPLPTGSCVVVIPAEEDARASLEFDLQVKVSLAMKPHIPTVPLRLRHALAEAAVSAALRALTEGEKP